MRKFLIGGLLLLIFLVAIFQVRADLDSDIDRLGADITALNKQLAGKEADYQKLKAQLLNIKAEIVAVAAGIVKKQQEVAAGEQVLEYQKNLLNQRARSYYKNISKSSVSLVDFLVTGNLSKTLDNFFYQKTIVDEDRKTIIKIVLYIKDLEEKKKALETEKTQLSLLKIEVDKQTAILAKDISETKEKIATLTAQQQQLIAQKLASLNLPRSALTSVSGCVDDRDKDPGFSPRFAFFTYGVPNRVGLNQYGARGRADAGQDAETILRAYYNFDNISDADTNIHIRVDGHGEYALEDYVKRIYEMPSDWSMEALKAQAIAARSYALAYTNNGSGSICDSQNCQVFQDAEKGGRWNEAVDATRGKIMAKGGQPIKAWYSSTHGGYIFSSGDIGWSGTDWTKHATDTTSGSAGSFDELKNNAYDKSSPWFYCDWGSRSEYNKTAWLKSEEVADIVNVILLARNLSTEDKDHLYQTDKPNPTGKETWGAERVKSELRSRGGQVFNTINDGSVGVDFGYGKTGSVNVSGDGGSVGIDASEFKNWFNLRAPSNIQIVGPLYNIEKR